MTLTKKCQVTDILTYALKRTRLKTLQMSPTAGVEELVKKASWPVIPILEIWNWFCWGRRSHSNPQGLELWHFIFVQLLRWRTSFKKACLASFVDLWRCDTYQLSIKIDQIGISAHLLTRKAQRSRYDFIMIFLLNVWIQYGLVQHGKTDVKTYFIDQLDCQTFSTKEVKFFPKSLCWNISFVKYSILNVNVVLKLKAFSQMATFSCWKQLLMLFNVYVQQLWWCCHNFCVCFSSYRKVDCSQNKWFWRTQLWKLTSFCKG